MTCERGRLICLFLGSIFAWALFVPTQSRSQPQSRTITVHAPGYPTGQVLAPWSDRWLEEIHLGESLHVGIVLANDEPLSYGYRERTRDVERDRSSGRSRTARGDDPNRTTIRGGSRFRPLDADDDQDDSAPTGRSGKEDDAEEAGETDQDSSEKK